MDPTVVTFYSFKGGVGRSFTLANVAILLARWGYRVLAIDWDLEAPGLHQYFAPLMTGPPAHGLVDLVDDFAAKATRPSAHLTRLNLEGPGTVDLLAAGRQDADYVGRVQRIDWAGLYESGFADFLERCRAEWLADHDFVLIDSRTGISDTGGICTAHLPDRLVVVFTPNVQSVEGVIDIASRANVARDRMPYDRPPLTVLPILSRLDNRVEYQRAEQWHRRCAELAAPLFRNWLVKKVPEDLMLRHVTLPYVSYWSFGENLPVEEERTPSADQISFALETVAAIIAHRFDRTDLLADNRDAYVAAARDLEREFELDVLVSSPRSARTLAEALIERLASLGVKAKGSLSGDVELLDTTRDSARHLCLVVDGQVSRWQATEAEQFLRSTITSDGDRRLFSVLTWNTVPARLPSYLRGLSHLWINGTSQMTEVARQLYAYLKGNGSAPPAETDQQAYLDATAALDRLPYWVAHRSRWDLIDQILLGMADALKNYEIESIRDLTLDLELASRIRTPGQASRQYATPANVRKAINQLRDMLTERISLS